MDDRLRDSLKGRLTPAFDEVGDASRRAFPGIHVDMGSHNSHDRVSFRLSMSIMFDPREDEHEAVHVYFVCQCASLLLDYRRGAYGFVDPDDESVLLEVETGRGSPITMLGPAFPGLVPPEQHDAFVETFAARAAEHLSDSIPAISRALERSEFRPTTS
jgi:hypothetical protein